MRTRTRPPLPAPHRAVCIFAYGQTGSGKTHTMVGTPEDAGLIPRAVDRLFAAAEAARARGWVHDVRASMVEVYNEEVVCLLGGAPPAGRKHAIVHCEADGSTAVTGAAVVQLADAGAARALARASGVRGCAPQRAAKSKRPGPKR